MKEKALTNIFVYIFLFFGLSIVVSIILNIFNISQTNIVALNIGNIVVYIGVTAALVFLNYKDILDSFKKFNRYTILKIIIGVMFIYSVSFIISLLFNDVSNNQENINKMYEKKSLLVIHACLLAPLTEEIVFRKSFKDLIKNPYIFLLVSSLTFGLFHCLSGDFENIIRYAIPGLVFSLIYLREENIGLNYIIHFLYNFIVILLV